MKEKILIICIFILALFLRVYKLGQYPVGFLWDEAALGYNAYSILKTGRDEYGEFLPIIFKSFGDYKPGLYVYLTVPSIVVFGLNEFGVRFPSALFGSLTVLIIYFAVKEGQKLVNGKEEGSDLIALLSSFLLAINPWHLSFSRGAWELNVMTFETVLGFYLLLRFLNSKRAFQLYLVSIVFILSLATYQSARFLIPALLLGFVYFFRKHLRIISWKLKLSSLFIFFGGFFLFNLLTLAGGKAGRIKVMSLFSYPRSPAESKMIQGQDDYQRLSWSIFHSNPVFFTRSVLGRYFNHFSGKFLFFNGDWSNPRNGVIYQGVLYYGDVFFLLLGLGVLFAKKINELDNLMLFWLLIAPLPAALTRDIISSVRSFTMVIPLIYILALGMSEMFRWVSKFSPFVKRTYYILHFTFYIFLFVRFLDLYFVHDPKFTSKDRLFGYKEMVECIKPMVKSKNKVVITTELGQPYIFYLFYSQYDPRLYQKQAFLKENPYGDVGEVEKIDNIEFRNIYWPDDRGLTNSLFIGDEFDLPLQDIVGQENIYFLKEIKFLNGKTAFRIVETK